MQSHRRLCDSSFSDKHFLRYVYGHTEYKCFAVLAFIDVSEAKHCTLIWLLERYMQVSIYYRMEQDRFLTE